MAALTLLPQTLRAQAPQLKIEQKVEKAVSLEKAEIAVSIVGPLASVTETLTFRNPNPRALEGELSFPLPDGASVSGYALDVSGEMVDAVPVERERARVAYETEVRAGVDPGLLEKGEGNSFTTRVYPIPANGTRTIRVTYQAELGTRGADRVVTVPLRWGVAPGVTEIRIACDIYGALPKSAQLGEQDLVFAVPDADRPAVAVLHRENAPLDADLVVRLPAPTEPVAYSEFFQRSSAENPENYFLIESHETLTPGPSLASTRSAGERGENLTVVWDASLSRRSADLKAERELLRLLLSRLDGATVRVFVLRDTLEPAQTFPIENGDASALLEFLDSVPLDGGTDLRALAKLPKTDGPTLLFTDGLSPLSPLSTAPALPGQTWTISSAARANFPLLRALGTLIDLSETPIGAALWQVGVPPFGLQKVTTLSGSLDGVTFEPGGSAVSGKLLSPEARVSLEYGYPGQPPLFRKEIRLSSPITGGQGANSGGRGAGAIAKFWASQQAEKLAVDPKTNREALTKLGQDFGIMTEGCSLLVLETLEQHLKYHVPPARSRPALYDAYLGKVREETKAQKTKDAAQFDKVKAQWKETLAWWGKDFQYPKGFQYKKPTQKNRIAHRSARPATGRAGDSSGGMAGGITPGQGYFYRPPSAVPERRVRVMKSEAGEEADESVGASVKIEPWTPNVPYVKSMNAAGAGGAYGVYLQEREKWGATPAFYLDAGEALLKLGRKDEGKRVLLSLADLAGDDPAVLRILARRLLALGEHDLAISLFERVLQMRPEEPQSLRDLALALEARGDKTGNLGDYDRALIHFDGVVRGRWIRGESDFDGIECIALLEANALLNRVGATRLKNPLDPALTGAVACDLRIVLAWDTDLTDMDLHVKEPSAEECFYSHNRTTVGGHLSHDCTRGYGPEEYFLRKAMPGTYTVSAQFYGSQAQKALGATTLQAVAITNFGRKNEKRAHLTLRLTDAKETVTIGKVTINP